MDKKNIEIWSVVLLRVSLGWLFFYAGITKVLAPAWSAAGYLNGAKSFAEFYHFLASPAVLPFINFINEWGLTLLGVSLVLGLWMRWSIPLGMVLMLLYYLPILDFPYPNAHDFLVDEHIIYIFALATLWSLKTVREWSLDAYYKIK